MFQKANSGLVFESFQILDPTVSPILVIVASDPSHVGHVSRHPMYCKCCQLLVTRTFLHNIISNNIQ